MEIGYRIVEDKNGKLYSLFHGTNRSREIKTDAWNKADIKIVCDGKNGFRYQSGWHYLPNKEKAEELLRTAFKNRRGRRVVMCYVRGNIRPKHSDNKGHGSFLADEIYIPSNQNF